MFTQQGKLVKKGEVQEGTSTKGTSWQRMQIVIQLPSSGSYENFMAFEVGSRNIVEVEKIPLNSEIEVGFFVNSREWNGKWYTNADLYSVNVIGDNAPEVKSEDMGKVLSEGSKKEEDGDLPF